MANPLPTAEPRLAPPPPSAAAPAPAATAAEHRFKFYRVGGLDQVALETGADLLALERLDPKLWVALASPTKGLELDARTLELLDTDRDGRVRVPEVLAAIRFCAARLRDVGTLLFGADDLPLAELRDDTPEGRAALGAARHLLARAGRPGADAVRPEDVADEAKVFEGAAVDGDGVVPPEAADAVDTRQLVLDVMATMGSVPGRSGKPGVDRAKVTAFFEEAEAYARWWARGEGDAGAMPLGDRTAAAYAALRAIRAKVDDFFVRCRLAEMEPRSAAALNRAEPEFGALAAKDLSAATADVGAFPLARAEAGRALPLGAGVNPAWATAVAALRRDVVAPMLGADRDALTHEEWRELVARFVGHEAWVAEKAGAKVEPLGIARVRALLGSGGRSALEALLARDEAFAPEAQAVGDVVRLVRYHRDLATLLRNFVSFADFYDPLRKAVFQAGTLYLDGRSCDLCVRVDDPNAHAGLGGLSRIYLAYCDCRRPGGETMKIAACFTQGDSDYLTAGRNGLFVDRRGRDWDATIVKIVENPISLRQAFWAPYKKLLRAIEEQVAKLAAARQARVGERIAAAPAQVTDAAEGQPQKPAAAGAADVGKTIGIVAALGVGAGALGTVLGGFVSGFMQLEPWWAKLVAFAAILAIVSGPFVLVAWLKLRHRTLGPVLDATGWAVNGRVRIGIPLATALTGRAVLPPGARRVLDDPYVDRGARRRRRLLALLVVAAAALVAAKVLGRWPFGPPPWSR